MRGKLYGVDASHRLVKASPLGVALSELFQLGPAPFDWDSGWVRRVMLRQVIPGKGTFVHVAHGWPWTRLNALIDAFDDRAVLAAEGGFGPHVLSTCPRPLLLAHSTVTHWPHPPPFLFQAENMPSKPVDLSHTPLKGLTRRPPVSSTKPCAEDPAPRLRRRRTRPVRRPSRRGGTRGTRSARCEGRLTTT